MSTDDKELNRARIFVRSGDLPRAQDLLEKHLQSQPDSIEGAHLLAEVMIRMGEAGEALRILKEQVDRGESHPQTHRLLGRILMDRGDTAGALAHYTTALRAAPSDVDTLEEIARALEAEGKLEQAERCLRKALEIRPDELKVHRSLAEFLERQDRLDEALAAVRLAREKTPKDPDLAWMEGDLLHRREDLAAAGQLFESLAKWHPQNPLGHLGLGRVDRSRGERTSALKHLRRAVTEAPSNVACLVELGAVELELGDFAAAAETATKAARLDTESVEVAMLVAWSHRARGLRLRAWLELKRVLALDETHPEAHRMLAELYLEEEMAAKAHEELDRVLEDQPDDPAMHLKRAEALALMGRVAEAEDDLRASGANGSPEGKLVEALIKVGRGQKPEGQKILDALLKSEPDGPLLVKARRALRRAARR